MRMAADHRDRAGVDPQLGERAIRLARLVAVLLAPMRQHDHGVGLGPVFGDQLGDHLAVAAAQDLIEVVGPLVGVDRARDEGDVEAVELGGRRPALGPALLAGADVAQLGRVEAGDGSVDAERPTIERVVVGGRDQVDARVLQVERDRGVIVEARVRGVDDAIVAAPRVCDLEALAVEPRRHRTFEVEHSEIRLGQRVRDASPEHRRALLGLVSLLLQLLMQEQVAREGQASVLAVRAGSREVEVVARQLPRRLGFDLLGLRIRLRIRARCNRCGLADRFAADVLNRRRLGAAERTSDHERRHAGPRPQVSRPPRTAKPGESSLKLVVAALVGLGLLRHAGILAPWTFGPKSLASCIDRHGHRQMIDFAALRAENFTLTFARAPAYLNPWCSLVGPV